MILTPEQRKSIDSIAQAARATKEAQDRLINEAVVARSWLGQFLAEIHDCIGSGAVDWCTYMEDPYWATVVDADANRIEMYRKRDPFTPVWLKCHTLNYRPVGAYTPWSIEIEMRDTKHLLGPDRSDIDKFIKNYVHLCFTDGVR